MTSQLKNSQKTIKILLLENIHPVAKKRLEEVSFTVELLKHSPNETEIISLLKDYDVLGIRSKTEVTEKIIENSPHLLAIGCFCIGTNQVNLSAANRAGVPVFNAPFSNTRSVAELVIAEMIALSRQLCDRSQMAHRGEWQKSADGSREVRGKTLGIVGYGHIGSQVSVLAESMGMKVVYFDVVKKLPLGNAISKNTLEEVLNVSDFVTLHVPETEQTKDMMGSLQFSQMKKGSFFINASRGTVVVIEDLVRALKEKQLGGAAIDVFPIEPASNKEIFKSPLQEIPNVILTPHVGGSTEEAQYAIGLEVAESFIRYLKNGSTSGAVNFPQVDLPVVKGTQRVLNVHRNEPGVLGEINGIVSQEGANILAQFLSTDPSIGYMVMDIDAPKSSLFGEKISKLSRSIKTRIIQE